MTTPLPDWNKVAEKFDLWLPHLAPATDALLRALDVAPHHRVLDIACGTGEPVFSVIRALGNSDQIVACDGAWGMVAATAAKAARHGIDLACVHMRAEDLAFDNESFDRVVCRFGVMLFDDPTAGAREIRRVLRPGGRVALAVWDRLDLMPTMRWCIDAFRDHIDADMLPATERINRYGDPDALAELVSALDLAHVSVTRHTLHYRFPAFDDYWGTLIASGIMQNQLDAVSAERHGNIKNAFARAAETFASDGELAIPHGYIVISGRK